VAEVEAQPVRRDQRALLLHVLAEHARSAACSRCVAVWLRSVSRRAAPRPRRDRTRRELALHVADHRDAPADAAHLVDRHRPPLAVDVARSETWPPLSA
jgi:hypothetical protein